MPTPADQLPPDASTLMRRITALERQVRELRAARNLNHSAIDNGALLVRDSNGTLRAVLGIQADGTVGLVTVNGTPPGAPSAPIVTPSIAGLRVTWDGTLTGDVPLPADFDHVAVYVSTSPGTAPTAATFAGTITLAGDGGMLPITPLPYQQHYVVFVGVNTSGAVGPVSVETAATPVQVTGPDIVAGAVTAGTIAAGSIGADKLTAVLQLATRIVAGDPAGARVELNASGLKAYNAAGTLTVNIDSTGTGTFTGTVTGSTITGGTITGATLQTATSGARAVLDTALKLYDSSGNLRAAGGPSVYPLLRPGWISTDGTFTTSSTSGYVAWYQEGYTYWNWPTTQAQVTAGTVSVRTMSSGTLDNAEGRVQAMMRMTANQASANVPPHVDLYADGTSTRCDVNVSGLLSAGNIATGTCTITPSAANTPTGFLVSGINVTGTTFRGYATANTTVPGSRVNATPSAAGVTGVSVSAVTATSLMVYVNRENTTATNVNWMVIGS